MFYYIFADFTYVSAMFILGIFSWITSAILARLNQPMIADLLGTLCTIFAMGVGVGLIWQLVKLINDLFMFVGNI